MDKTKNNLPDHTMSLGDHLEELRTRLILAISGLVIATIACFALGKKIIIFVQLPYDRLMPDHPLNALAPADAFIGYMKISLIAGVIISSPWIFYQIWMFISAGLYPHEKRYVKLAAPFCAILFASGALFFMFFVARITLLFFIQFGQLINVSSNWTFQSYISFMTSMMLVFGLAFQTPVAIFFLNRTGLVSSKNLKSSRKYVLLAVFVVSAIATPPDVVSQITLALPLYLLYELGILLCNFADRKKNQKVTG